MEFSVGTDEHDCCKTANGKFSFLLLFVLAIFWSGVNSSQDGGYTLTSGNSNWKIMVVIKEVLMVAGKVL